MFVIREVRVRTYFSHLPYLRGKDICTSEKIFSSTQNHDVTKKVARGKKITKMQPLISRTGKNSTNRTHVIKLSRRSKTIMISY